MHHPNYDQSHKYAIWEEAPANHLWYKMHLHISKGKHMILHNWSAAIMFTWKKCTSYGYNST